MKSYQADINKYNLALVVVFYHTVFFGFSFLLNYDLISFIGFLISFIIILLSMLYAIPSKLVITHSNLQNLSKFYNFAFSIIMAYLIYIAMNPPIFSDNVNIDRVLFRNIFIVKYIFQPLLGVFSLLVCLLYFLSKDSKYLISFFMVFIIGLLSGYRAATIVIFIQYIILSFVFSNSIYAFFKANKYLLFIVPILVFFLLLTTAYRLDFDNLETIYQALLHRVFDENASLNHERYLKYSLDNGLQYGYTWLHDIYSLIGLENYSFQELLSNSGLLVMTTPFYSELYVNFGVWSFIISGIIGALLIVYFKSIPIILNKTEYIIFILYLLLGVFPSILQAGFSKYLFVAIPKFIIILLAFSFLSRIKINE